MKVETRGQKVLGRRLGKSRPGRGGGLSWGQGGGGKEEGNNKRERAGISRLWGWRGIKMDLEFWLSEGGQIGLVPDMTRF